MKPYGLPRFASCCPGHDKWPVESYDSRCSMHKFRRMVKKLHRRGRRVAKHALRCEAMESYSTE